MTYIKIVIACLFVSCSCEKREQGEYGTAVGSMSEVPPRFSDDSMPLIVNPETSIVNASFQPFQNEEIDTSMDVDTNKRTHNQSKNRNNMVKHSTVKIAPVRDTKSGCFGFSVNPLTGENAAECSMYHWETAWELLSRGAVDSALIHCKRAQSLYENGSIFFLKAKILGRLNRWSEALQAAEISLDRNDHWKQQDKDGSKIERCIALKAMYQKYPSSELHQKLARCQKSIAGE